MPAETCFPFPTEISAGSDLESPWEKACVTTAMPIASNSANLKVARLLIGFLTVRYSLFAIR